MFDYRIYARIKERDLSMWKDCSINGFKKIFVSEYVVDFTF